MPSIATESLPPWVFALSIGGILVLVMVQFKLLEYVPHLIRDVWIPWMVEKHMRKQGYSGPSFGWLKDNSGEMQELTTRATAEAFHTSSSGISHDFMPRVLAPIHTWRHLYGDRFIYKQGSHVTMHLSDAEAIKEVFCNKFGQLGKLSGRALSSDVVGSKGLAFAEQEEWARQRRVARPAFYMTRSMKLVVQMASWIQTWLRRLDTLVGDEGALNVDIVPEFEDLTKDILARYLFGSSFAKGGYQLP
ncbi:unnamed protein product [Calypogeia fissa]